VRDAREVLGTIVTITAYGDDTAEIETAIEVAYAEMSAVESALDVYGGEDAEPGTCGTAARINRMPYEWSPLPAEAQAVLARTQDLEVEAVFSPSLFGVQRLYEFEKGGTVPDADDLAAAVEAAASFETREADGVVDGRFAPPAGGQASAAPDTDPPAPSASATGTATDSAPAGGPVPTVGVDFGGAAKGLGLDRAVAALRESGAVDAAVVSAGSTTIAIGDKPDGSPWKIGIEDPRDPESVVSVVEGTGDLIVSTSGDYQRYFEIDGTRYHHILDPSTGMPARGLRSLTVVGAGSGLDSDILSTALFVMGTERAAGYAERRELGLYAIDGEGRARITPGPDDSYSFGDAE
jgi:thiamine biosynthesis lipoprotein ApbE